MSTDRKSVEHNRLLNEIEDKLDTLILTMDEHPSYYEGVIRIIRDARKIVRTNPKKVLQEVERAIALSEQESGVVLEYRRMVDGIAPDDPVFSEKKVSEAMAEYHQRMRQGDVKGAQKHLADLRKAIGGRGRPPAISVRLESPRISREDMTARLIVTNVDKADVILNSVYASTSVWSEDVLLTIPAIRSGDSAQVPIVMGEDAAGSPVMHVTVTYTRELSPVKQRYDFKIFVE